MLHGLGYNCRFAGAYVGVGHLNLYLKGTVLTKNGYFSFVDCTVEGILFIGVASQQWGYRLYRSQSSLISVVHLDNKWSILQKVSYIHELLDVLYSKCQHKVLDTSLILSSRC